MFHFKNSCQIALGADDMQNSWSKISAAILNLNQHCYHIILDKPWKESKMLDNESPDTGMVVFIQNLNICFECEKKLNVEL